MHCVKCDGELGRVSVDGVEVDQCPDCSGIWFDFGELERVLDAKDTETLRAHVEAHREHDAVEAPCPACGGEGNMVSVKRMGHDLHIDTCTVCYGQWLDGGELDALKENGIVAGLLSLFKR